MTCYLFELLKCTCRSYRRVSPSVSAAGTGAYHWASCMEVIDYIGCWCVKKEPESVESSASVRFSYSPTVWPIHLCTRHLSNCIAQLGSRSVRQSVNGKSGTAISFLQPTMAKSFKTFSWFCFQANVSDESMYSIISLCIAVVPSAPRFQTFSAIEVRCAPLSTKAALLTVETGQSVSRPEPW